MENRRVLAGEFTDISAGLVDVTAGNTAFGDYDDDGDLDILLTGYVGGSGYGTYVSRIYQNTSGTFSDISAGLQGVNGGSVAWGDYDNDGDLDLHIVGFAYLVGFVSRIYENTDGTFTEGPEIRDVEPLTTAWGDYDNDGDLDILLTGAGFVTRIYQNTNSTFSDINAGLPGVDSQSAAFGDYDNDGDLDIVLAGTTNGNIRITRVYRNTAGTFSDVAAGLPGVAGGRIAWGDYDNDGDLDILQTGAAGTPANSTRISRVYQNTDGAFSDISAGLPGVVGGSVAWGDYDNDGDLDILLAGVLDSSSRVARVYENSSGTFSDIGAGLGDIAATSSAWGDYDDDGDLDILLVGEDADNNYHSQLYRNNGLTFNRVPDAPSNLTATVNSDTSAVLAWAPPPDQDPVPGGTGTPGTGLNYNLRVGTKPGGSDVVGPMSFQNPPGAQTDGLRKIAQRGLIQGTSWTLVDLVPGQTYYWSVQAIDTALAGGPFGMEQSFSLPFSDKIGVKRGNQFLQDVNGTGEWEGASDRLDTFGDVADGALSGDWNGDGLDEIGAQRGRAFYLDMNGNGVWDGPEGGDRVTKFGNVGDTPIAGDWDGDGTDDIGVQRGNAFYLDASGDGVWGGLASGDLFFTFGNAGDTPLPGDWDGDDSDEIGVHRLNQFLLDLNSDGSWGTGDVVYEFGNATDIAVKGDWDGDGVDEIGVKRAEMYFLDMDGSGAWNGSTGDTAHTFGNPTDLALIGRWHPLSPLMAAAGEASSASNVAPLTPGALAPIVTQAIVLWADTGLSPAQIQSLQRVTFSIADLPGAQLGLSLGGTILIDRDAASYGWMVDPTPADDAEFSNSPIPNPQSLDLLSAVLHELGHELGLDHDDDVEAMCETLAVGTRRLP